jgi:hypothetical protein
MGKSDSTLGYVNEIQYHKMNVLKYASWSTENAMQTDLTKALDRSLMTDIMRNIPPNIMAYGRGSSGKSSVILRYANMIDHIYEQLGHSKDIDRFECIAQDQNEGNRLLMKGYTHRALVFDELSMLGHSGLNSTVEENVFETRSSSSVLSDTRHS